MANCVCASDCPTITVVGCLSREKKRYKTVEKLLDLLSIGAFSDLTVATLLLRENIFV